MLIKNLWLPASILIISSCSPKIQFNASPPIITKGDSVFLNWKIKGEPTLMFDQRKIAHAPDDSLELLEFTLSVEKRGKTKYIKRQITVLPAQSVDRVALFTTDIKGDTLIAEGVKDSAAWKHFQIVSISSLSNDAFTVIHDGVTATIKNTDLPDGSWKNKNYAGDWIIMRQLSDAEKQDHSKIPGSLEIQVLIQQRKN